MSAWDQWDQQESSEGTTQVITDQLRLLLENALDIVTVVSCDGTIRYQSPSVERVLGYRPEELLGRNAFTFIHRDDRARVRGLMAQAVQHAGTATSGDFRFRHRDGSWRILEAVGKAMPEGSELIGVVNSRDVTERKRSEEQLRKLWRAVEQNPSCIVITDVEGRIEYANPKFCEVSGYSLAEVIGRNPGFLQSGHTPRAEYERLWTTITAGGEWRGNFVNRKKDGELFEVSAAISPITDPAGTITHFMEIGEDVTERRRAEEELQKQREMIYQSEKLAAMGQLLAGVAHELNNPLSVVVGRAALLRARLADAALGGQVEKLADAADRCARIVRNFLALARQRPPERQEVRLNRIVEEAVEMLAYPLRVDGIHVSLELAPDLPTLWADPHQLHQVVVNLVSNAHQAMREVGQMQPRRLTLTSRLDSATGRISLEVADTGPGIPADIQWRIFEPFFTTKPPGQGTGLGLPLCQGIVESHGGTIHVTSRPGDGTVFRVELPVQARPANTPDLTEVLPPVPAKAILVVDDEPEVARVLADMLAVDGHRVETAANGLMALEKLRAHAFDVIMSDLRMPDMNGPRLYRELERLDPAACRRFVFLTGDTLSEDTRQFLEQTPVPNIEKPFGLDDVRRALHTLARPS